MFFGRSSSANLESSASAVKESTRTLNLFLKPPSAGLTTKCIQVSENLTTTSLWEKVRSLAAPPAAVPPLIQEGRGAPQIEPGE